MNLTTRVCVYVCVCVCCVYNNLYLRKPVFKDNKTAPVTMLTFVYKPEACLQDNLCIKTS